jgi:hypothetical protein
MTPRREAIDFDRENETIISRLDIVAEYEAMGVVFPHRERVKANGFVDCFAYNRDERNPSAAVNVKTGRYVDMGSGINESIWDFACKLAGKFSDFREARKFFAEKAGVEFVTSGGSSRSQPESRDEKVSSIRWHEWSTGRETIASMWGKTLKKRISLDALKYAGGKFGEFPVWRDKVTKEESIGEFKVVGIPAYAADADTFDRPPCWVLWNATGTFLTLHRGPNVEPERIKMRSVGSSRGTLMNRGGLEQLAAGWKPELVIKTGGPTDMLALLSACPAEWRTRIFITTNASGETGEVVESQIERLASVPVLNIGDRDLAGSVGALRWLSSLRGKRRSVVLPYRLLDKHGKDSRDFVNGVRE